MPASRQWRNLTPFYLMKTKTHKKLQSCGFFVFLAGLLTLLLLKGCTQPQPISYLLVGGTETVCVQDITPCFTARMDTGAQTSSIHAEGIEYVQKNDQTWARFNLINPNQQVQVLELPLIRQAKIYQSNSVVPQTRPVVELSIRIQNKVFTAEFTLANRQHLKYSVLIGRNILQQGFWVDVSN
jgi:hypothetical protein